MAATRVLLARLWKACVKISLTMVHEPRAGRTRPTKTAPNPGERLKVNRAPQLWRQVLAEPVQVVGRRPIASEAYVE
jgi:hypothetical protein